MNRTEEIELLEQPRNSGIARTSIPSASRPSKLSRNRSGATLLTVKLSRAYSNLASRYLREEEVE